MVVKPLETRALEGALILIGAAILAFGGFVAARPLDLGTATDSSSTSIGPVTLSHLTTAGTTPTVVTEVKLKRTSSVSHARSSSEAWLGTIFGIGTLLVLSGALYRRVTSLSGFGLSIDLQGVVDDPETQAAVAQRIKDAHPDATPEEAALLSAKALSRLPAVMAEQRTAAIAARPPGARRRLSALAARATGKEAPLRVAVLDAKAMPPTEDEIAQAVADAAAEVFDSSRVG